jgi:deoxyribonuclease V
VWPTGADALAALQTELAARARRAPPWEAPIDPVRVAGCWVCFPRGLSGPGAAGDRAWTAATVHEDGRVVDERVRVDVADAPYRPGLLALRLGRPMEQVVRSLTVRPDVLLVDATAGDHPREAGLALHLGAELDLPTIGVTHRPLVARGEWPADERGATSPLLLGGLTVGCWLRTRPGTRPLAVHPGWRVDLPTAVDVVLAMTARQRTPEPLRSARHLARLARESARLSP